MGDKKKFITIIWGGASPLPRPHSPDQHHNRYRPVITVGGVGGDFSETAKVIPIVVGALGTVTKGLEKNLKKAGSNVAVELLQKAALLGTSRILTRVLDSD